MRSKRSSGGSNPGASAPARSAAAAAQAALTSVPINSPAAAANAATAPKLHILFGRGHVVERLCGLSFEVSSDSFFQTNTRQAEVGTKPYKGLSCVVYHVQSPVPCQHAPCRGGHITLKLLFSWSSTGGGGHPLRICCIGQL